jgi:hypothetical protein
MAQGRHGIGQMLQSLPKPILYLILILATSVPLFFKIAVPNEPVEASTDFYAQLMKLPKGSRVLIASDWTNSTRGESMGEFEALMKILMRRGIKFAVYSTGDPQAPQVARDTIRRMVAEVSSDGYPAYKPFEDYVILGYFPNSEGTTNAINNNVRVVFAGKKDSPAGSGPRDVFQSPVLRDVQQVSDFNFLIVVTGSQTNTVTVERVKKTPLMFMVTGVMVPESQVFYASGQIKGLVGGTKGVYDLETLMEKGVAPQSATGDNLYKSAKYPDGVEGFPGKKNAGKGTAYNLALHFAIGLLILAVVVGNVGMFLARRRAG